MTREPPRVYLVGGPGGAGRAELPRPEEQPDVVGRERPRRRWPAAVVAAVLVAGLLGVRADAAVEQRELDALLERADAGLAAVAYGERRVQGFVRYFSPALVSPGVEQRVRDSLQGIVREEAAEQLPLLREQRASALTVRVLPWHGAEREARARWVAYLDAWIGYLHEVQAEFRRLYQPRPEQEEALRAAREAFARAGAAPERTDEVFDR